MKSPIKTAAATALAAAAGLTAASAQSPAPSSIPSVVVSIENVAPINGSFLTPVWVGFHNGQFDTYDGGTFADSLPIPGSDAIERLAEDGNTGPISRDFAELVPNGADGTIISNGNLPPLGPGQTSSRLFRVNPAETQYFSYATMIIPSNDAFVSNGSPFAHPVFDEAGNFVGQPFYVRGNQVDDAGTELNDEKPANTAFFGQAAPDTGVSTREVIPAGAIPNGGHPGLQAPRPGNILGTGLFQDADFTQADYDLMRIKLTFLDLASPVLFTAELDNQFAIPGSDSNAKGRAYFFLDDDGESLVYFVFANGLSSNLTLAHLHLAPNLQTGPVTLPLDITFGRFAFGRIKAVDVVGPLNRDGADGFDDLETVISEMVSGSTYVNLHTVANPAGEIRGQVFTNTY